MYMHLFPYLIATSDMLYDMIKLSMERLIASEDELNKLDKESGDGDCGTTLARGAKGRHCLRGQGSKGRHCLRGQGSKGRHCLRVRGQR
jgi:hypothetical protein